jgi:peptidoglycan/xylan/chitin deacetylase (PgdA/CDA1 family)
MRSLKRLQVIAISLILVSGVVFYGFLRTRYVPPILMYHMIVQKPAPENMVAVSLQAFERQMRFLKEHRYNVIPLESLAGLIRQNKRIPAKTVVITFDDGWDNVYKYAFPVLKKYKLPAAFFIITNEVGRIGPLGYRDRVSWDELKEMQDSGLITIGSHCLGPEPLINIKSDEVIKHEIFGSKKVLEQRLGRPVQLFSYPEGKFDAKIRNWVIEAGYTCAVATKPGKDYPSNDPFALKRLRISENASNLLVFWFESTGYYTALKEKKRK